MKTKLLSLSSVILILLSVSLFSGCQNTGNHSGTVARHEATAQEMTTAVQNLYAAVIAGNITQDTSAAELNALSASKLPASHDSTERRKQIADNLTIMDAIDYDALASRLDSTDISEFGYTPSDGRIFYQSTYRGNKTLVSLSSDTTLREIKST